MPSSKPGQMRFKFYPCMSLINDFPCLIFCSPNPKGDTGSWEPLVFSSDNDVHKHAGFFNSKWGHYWTGVYLIYVHCQKMSNVFVQKQAEKRGFFAVGLYIFYFYRHCTFILLYPLQQSCRGVYWFHHVHPSVRPSVDKSYVFYNLSCVS